MINNEFANVFYEAQKSSEAITAFLDRAAKYFDNENGAIIGVDVTQNDAEDYFRVKKRTEELIKIVVDIGNKINFLGSLYAKDNNTTKPLLGRCIMQLRQKLVEANKFHNEVESSLERVQRVFTKSKSKEELREFSIKKIFSYIDALISLQDQHLSSINNSEKISKLKYILFFNELCFQVKDFQKVTLSTDKEVQEILKYIEVISPLVNSYKEKLKAQGFKKFDSDSLRAKIKEEKEAQAAVGSGGGGGGGGKTSMEEVNQEPETMETAGGGAAASSTASLEDDTLASLRELVRFAFFGEGKKQYRNLSRVRRWDIPLLTPEKIYANPAKFGDYADKDKNYLNQQIIAHSGKGVDRLLNNPTLQQQFCEPIESGFLVRCILKIKGEKARHVTGSFLLRCTQEDEVFHRGFQRELWGAKFDHLLQINVSNKEGGSKEGERLTEEEGFEDVSDLRVNVLEDGNLCIELNNHSLIESYVILRNQALVLQ